MMKSVNENQINILLWTKTSNSSHYSHYSGYGCKFAPHVASTTFRMGGRTLARPLGGCDLKGRKCR